MTTRAAALAVVVGGLAMAVLPALPWYVVDVDGRQASARGIVAAGQLWLLPALGAAAVIAGLVLVAGPAPAGSHRARVVATVAGVAGAVGALSAALAALDPPVRLELPGAGLPGPVAAPVALTPAAYLTPAACLVVVAAALVLGRIAIPRARPRAEPHPPRRR